MIERWRKIVIELTSTIGAVSLNTIKLFQPFGSYIAFLLGCSAFVSYVHRNCLTTACVIIPIHAPLYLVGIFYIISFLVCQHLVPMASVPLPAKLSASLYMFSTPLLVILSTVSWVLSTPLFLIVGYPFLVLLFPGASRGLTAVFALSSITIAPIGFVELLGSLYLIALGALLSVTRIQLPHFGSRMLLMIEHVVANLAVGTIFTSSSFVFAEFTNRLGLSALGALEFHNSTSSRLERYA